MSSISRQVSRTRASEIHLTFRFPSFDNARIRLTVSLF